MRTGGSYYGATAVGAPTAVDLARARELGRRLALVPRRLAAGEPP